MRQPRRQIRHLLVICYRSLTQHQLVSFDIDGDARAIGDIAGHQGTTDAGLQLVLQEPLQMCSGFPVCAVGGEPPT